MGEDGGVVATAQNLPWCGQILHDDRINGTHTGDLEFREEAVMNLIREWVIEHRPLGKGVAVLREQMIGALFPIGRYNSPKLTFSIRFNH
jgi:hypothetical protein